MQPRKKPWQLRSVGPEGQRRLPAVIAEVRLAGDEEWAAKLSIRGFFLKALWSLKLLN